MPFTYDPTGLINGVGGAIMGIALGGYNDQRQLRQQQELQEMQIRGAKEMTDYQKMKELEMWNNTNYEAQVKHLKGAGLNPALLYGKGGAGGMTTGGTAPSVSGTQAPSGGREIQDMIGMGMNMELLKAQKDLLQAQAENVKADTVKKSGVDTQEAQTRIQSLTQGISNQKAVEAMTKAETALKALELEVGKNTQEDREDFIYYQTKQAMYAVGEAERQQFISRATMNSKVDIVRAEAIGAVLKNELTQAQTAKTGSDIQVNQKQINLWIQENMRQWDTLELEKKKQAVQALIADYNTDPVNKVAENVSRMIDNIFIITKQGLSEVKRNPIGFKQ